MAKRKTPLAAAKRKRKVPDGPVRNKERTKQKLIKAVGKVFIKEGHAGLNAVKIASAAKVDRKLIYLYFGSTDNLIDRYFKENDFWTSSLNEDIGQLLSEQGQLTKNDILDILLGQLGSVMTNKAFLKSIQWEICEKSRLMRKIADERERIGEALFGLTGDGSPADLRAILALQIAGIYYLALHAKVNGSTFCGIDINEPAGLQRIEKALEMILDNAYRKGKEKKL